MWRRICKGVVPPLGNPETFAADRRRTIGYLKFTGPCTHVEIGHPYAGERKLSRRRTGRSPCFAISANDDPNNAMEPESWPRSRNEVGSRLPCGAKGHVSLGDDGPSK